MKSAVFNRLRILFVISLCCCILLGTALTLAQFVGIVFEVPALVEESEELLLRPAIAAAAAFGLFSFVASYFQAGGKENDEELEEI